MSETVKPERPQQGDLAELFRDWDRDELAQFAGYLLRSYRVMDAFWYLNLEKELGEETADRLNEKVWAKTSQLATREIMKRFEIAGGGLSALVKVLRYYPWNLLTGYEIEERENEFILRVPWCPSQEGRKKHGLGEYACKAMHRSEFESIAREVDPGIVVECIFAPPDDHPPEQYCEWRFFMKEPQIDTDTHG